MTKKWGGGSEAQKPMSLKRGGLKPSSLIEVYAYERISTCSPTVKCLLLLQRVTDNWLCSKKHVTTFLMISWRRTVRLQRFLAHLLPRVQAIDTYFVQLLYLGKLSRLKYQQQLNKIMKISQKDVILIKNLYLSKQYGTGRRLNELHDKGWILGSIHSLLNRSHKTGTIVPQ